MQEDPRRERMQEDPKKKADGRRINWERRPPDNGPTEIPDDPLEAFLLRKQQREEKNKTSVKTVFCLEYV